DASDDIRVITLFVAAIVCMMIILLDAVAPFSRSCFRAITREAAISSLSSASPVVLRSQSLGRNNVRRKF
ncbi:hypothetical protein Y032_0735g1933, partial [Ancylostoma ceylanicum]